ncbi:NUDIX domain-containing protein [Streptomyces sp. NRRL S-241]|uniref:NUDIX domain-containing protein n=1 Tax=Streptomyces sp. NRRL S-241 TaxID=1463896 RepID=UPI0007C52777|nr:NUDIX hydrolase [Streptomyces sp. NRRL S-241]
MSTLVPKAEWLAGLPQVVAVGSMLVTDDDGLMLLVKVSYGSCTWQFPGGWLDLGESPAVCAERELAEETGLNCQATGLLAVMWSIPTESTGGRAVVQFLFDAGKVPAGAPVRLQDSELSEARWVRPAEAMRLLDVDRGAWLKAALRAAEGEPSQVLVR